MNKNLEKELEKLINKKVIDEEVKEINCNKPFFYKKDFKTIKEGIPNYYGLDKLNRSSGGIAFVSDYTRAIITSDKRNVYYPEPSGWNKVKNKEIFEKCHIIAFSLSAKKTNYNNVFIGTNYLNRTLMEPIENEVYNHIKDNKDAKVLYRVTPVYNDEEIIPRGVLIEAQDENDQSFHCCKFCYNIIKNIKFRYRDGKIISSEILEEKSDKKSSDKEKTKVKKQKKKKESYNNYIINRKTMVYHIQEEKCKNIQEVDKKYLKEIRTTKEALKIQKIRPCKICNKNLK